MRTQDVREITSISAARSWAERGEREQEAPAWRARRQLDGCPGCKSAFIWGLQPRAQLHRGPQITSEWLASWGSC